MIGLHHVLATMACLTSSHSIVSAGTVGISQATKRLPLSFVNNINNGLVNAYISGLDLDGGLVMLKSDETFYRPHAIQNATKPTPIDASIKIPLKEKGDTLEITLPDYIYAARVWFAVGELEFSVVWSDGIQGPALVEPSATDLENPNAAVNWGYVELTNTPSNGLVANLSYVDFVGLILGMSLITGDGSVQSARGLRSNAILELCKCLRTRAETDGTPWSELCQTNDSGEPIRVLAPIKYLSENITSFASYWAAYVEQVWDRYRTETLSIDTQSAVGTVTCRLENELLTCAGDNRGYGKPSSKDVFGCNTGPFAISQGDSTIHRLVVPRLCAAFNRGTLTKTGGELQPSLFASSYYVDGTANWYSKFVHDGAIDGKGYAFSYDDVHPRGDVDPSGLLADLSPQSLSIYVGGF